MLKAFLPFLPLSLLFFLWISWRETQSTLTQLYKKSERFYSKTPSIIVFSACWGSDVVLNSRILRRVTASFGIRAGQSEVRKIFVFIGQKKILSAFLEHTNLKHRHYDNLILYLTLNIIRPWSIFFSDGKTRRNLVKDGRYKNRLQITISRNQGYSLVVK